ncbi:MAG TPA: hypothetical protein VM204_05105 [Gaiellaceae bacterium]|nr:hypothetical protein [Gaiellaceae bacterium]
MKKLTITALVALASLVLAGAALAALKPGVHDPGNLKCVSAKLIKGWLHLEKTCPTTADAAAGAQITGAEGKTFESAQFTLKSATQCQGGSPRFVVVTSTGLYPLGCNNVTPTINQNGTATYLFTAETLAAAGQQVPTPTGTISFVSVLIDVQGVADLKNIRFNGVLQKVVKTGKKADFAAACKNGGWKTFTNPAFKNQGQCVKKAVHTRNALRKATTG